MPKLLRVRNGRKRRLNSAREHCTIPRESCCAHRRADRSVGDTACSFSRFGEHIGGLPMLSSASDGPSSPITKCRPEALRLDPCTCANDPDAAGAAALSTALEFLWQQFAARYQAHRAVATSRSRHRCKHTLPGSAGTARGRPRHQKRRRPSPLRGHLLVQRELQLHSPEAGCCDRRRADTTCTLSLGSPYSLHARAAGGSCWRRRPLFCYVLVLPGWMEVLTLIASSRRRERHCQPLAPVSQ